MRRFGLSDLCAGVAAAAADRARVTVALVLVLTALLGALAVPRLGIDTGTDEMIAAEVPFRRNEIAFERAFPQLTHLLVVVVDGRTADDAERAAAGLADALAQMPTLFASVRRPDALPFLETSGALYLPLETVAELTDRLVAAQPILAPLAADPSARGLAAAVDLLAEGLARGVIAPAQPAPALDAIAAAVESVLAGRPEPLAWDRIVAAGVVPDDPRGTRRIVLAQPTRDEDSLAPGARAMAAVRAAALDTAPGARVRLTGPVALDGEELAMAATGAGWGLAMSFVLVTALLGLALRSWRLVAVTLATLVVGLIWTTGFAALAVGTLNLISIAFGIMFVGIGVDFGVQYAVRYASTAAPTANEAVALAGQRAGGAMALAAAATAAGFFAFLPTAFDGVAELGLIAGTGMVIALVLNLTLLPALIVHFRAPRQTKRPDSGRLDAIDAALAVHSRHVIVGAVVVAVVALSLVPFVRFDPDPLNLKDPMSESVATLRDLLADPLFAAYGLDVIVPEAEAPAMAARLDALPEVGAVRTLADLLPADQEAKLALFEDAQFVLGPTLEPAAVAEAPSAAEVVAALRATAGRLVALPPEVSDVAVMRLANALDAAADRGAALVPALAHALVSGVPELLAQLRALLAQRPVTEADLPAELVADWRAGELTRIVVQPAAAPESDELVRFVDAVAGVAPQATGMAASVVASADVVVGAFLTASALAIAAIGGILGLAMRRLVDIALVLAPLALAAAMTFAEAVALGLSINFANVIVLPLLLGIGVSFPIYLVAGWRAGVEGVVRTPTARAVLFSALTTASAFGTLALARHPGTAAMGSLLLLAIANLIVTNLVVLPALLAAAGRPSR